MMALIVKLAVMLLFIAELCLLCWAEEAYLFSFPFFLDLVSILSFAPDVVLLARWVGDLASFLSFISSAPFSVFVRYRQGLG